MGRASDFFYKELAIDDIAESKYFTPSTTTYTDYFADILITPLFGYQSVAVINNLGTTIKFLQMIRAEVLDNGHLISHTGGIDPYGYAWMWGAGTVGRLGDNTTTANSSPVSVVGGIKFNQIVNSQISNCGLDYDGFAWCWGNGNEGTCGDNSTNDHSSPVSVVGGYQFAAVTIAGNTIKALDLSGFAWAWGFNDQGQIGDNGIDWHSSPVSVVGGLNFVAIDGCLAIDTNNNVWSWGDNSYGQLGDGTTTNRSSPVGMLGIGSSGSITQITNQGTQHSLMLTSDGYCWAVGNDSNGQLGDGTVGNNCSSPISVIGNKKFVQIFTDGNTSFGLDDMGQMWGWGDNSTGKIGDGTTTDKTSPTAVRQGTRKFIQIAAGNGSVTAIDMDGNLWAWGKIPWITTSTVYSSYPELLRDFKAQVKKY